MAIDTYVLFAGGMSGFNLTAIGVAAYRRENGELIGHRFDTLERACVRGDLIGWACEDTGFHEHLAAGPIGTFYLPADGAHMTRILESTGNVMSSIRWDKAATSIDAVLDRRTPAEFVDDMFYLVVRPDLKPGKRAPSDG